MARGGINVEIKGDYTDKDIKRAIRDLDALKTQSGAASAPMAGLGKTILAAGAAFASFAAAGKVVDFMRDSIAAAMEEEAAIAALGRAFDNLGLKSQIPAAENGIRRLSKMAAVADDQLRPALQTLVTATGDVSKSQALLETALNASAATGKSLESITMAISKASTGQVSALKRLGIPLDDNIVKTKDFAAAIAVMNEKFGGQAATAAKTYAGQMKAVSIAVDEAKETIGFALLDAVTNATDAFGGSQGITVAIEDFSLKMADAIETASGLVGLAAEIKQRVDDLTTSLNMGADASTDWFDRVMDMIPGGDQLLNMLGLLAQAGDVWNGVQMDVADVAPSATNAYVRMHPAMLDVATAAAAAAGATGDAAEEMEKARTASDLLKASLDRYTTGDDVVLAMRELAKAARESKGDLESNKTAAINLRSEFGTAAGAVLEFATANGTSAANVLELWDKGLADLRKKLIKNGVKPSDVDAFINERLWLTRFTLLADVIGTGRAAEAMRLAGLAAGRQAWKGIVAGLDEGRGEVALSAGQLAAAARYAALAELEINSPSKVFYRMGLSAGDGLADGLTESQAKVAAKAAALVAEAGKAALAEAKSQRDQARAAMASMSEGIVGQVLGNVGFSTTDAEGNALTPEQIVQSILGSTANQSAAVAAIASNLGTALPPALLSQILAMPPETAIALANYLGGPEGSILRQTLVSNYTQLATDTETLLGDPMGVAWAKVGDKSAKDMLAEARKLISERAAGFSAWVAKQLETTVDVNVRFNGNGPEPRAAGGPVRSGSTYLVGERGPELFTPSASGSIVPNHALGSSRGGTTVVNINMTATPATDRRRLGQELHETLAAFYAANGM